MAKATEITVDIKVNIEYEQATRALQIVEWFLNDNGNYRLYQGKRKYHDREKTILSIIEL